MVKNKKFRKMPKISLAEKPDFKGDYYFSGPKSHRNLGPFFLVVFFIGRGDNVSCAL